jgi:uncharacterized protein involved in high-affinity Fe2+ transport
MSHGATQQPSDEVDEKQLRLATEEGEAYQRSARYMIEEVAHTGAMTDAGAFTVAIAQEEAEGMYRPADDGQLEWVEPDEDENCHLEVAVSDVADGRFVPELEVRARLVPDDGDAVGPVEVPFVWHPGLHHYGANLSVPGDGTYTVHVHIEPPGFPRHDEANGDRYADPVDVTFDDVAVETGRE